MAKKFNKSLLNEELKKFRLLSEYTFYNEEPKKDDKLILGSGLEEADEEPAEPAAAPEETAPVDDSKTAANQETGADDADNLFSTDDTEDAGTDDAAAGNMGAEDDAAGNMGADDADMGADDAEAGNMGAEDAGDEVEVDVTQLVKGSEEAKQSANDASQKTSELLNKFNDLEQRVAAMDSITNKIETLEKEIIKRNPTPVEKLEMRSLSSFPYNIKLTDYWKDVDGYNATSPDETNVEYTLTKDDVDSGFTDSSIKSSFNVPDEYEEEDV